MKLEFLKFLKVFMKPAMRSFLIFWGWFLINVFLIKKTCTNNIKHGYIFWYHNYFRKSWVMFSQLAILTKPSFSHLINIMQSVIPSASLHHRNQNIVSPLNLKTAPLSQISADFLKTLKSPNLPSSFLFFKVPTVRARPILFIRMRHTWPR